MKDQLIDAIQKDSWMIDILESVRSLDLPNCWIGAGFVRNKAWDILHRYKKRTPLVDIDVVFFDKNKCSIEYEKEIQSKLTQMNPKVDWEIINQARTHLWHNHPPYSSTEEAISKWVETATCIAVRLTKNNDLQIIAPYGFNDIEQLILRPIPSLENLSTFTQRVESKNWITKWPRLKVKQ